MLMSVNQYKQSTNKFYQRERKKAKTVSRKLEKKIAMQEKNRHDQAMAESRTEKKKWLSQEYQISDPLVKTCEHFIDFVYPNQRERKNAK